MAQIHPPITVSVKVAAEMLSPLSVWTVRELCRKGEIDSGLAGRRRLVFLDSVNAYAENLRQQNDQPKASA